MNYKEIAKNTGLKINHVKMVLEGKRKASLSDKITIRFAITHLKLNKL
ncbi:hypothetical protein [Chishuiella sp.]|nr:hypothetical protein [Chishuiella sp.]